MRAVFINLNAWLRSSTGPRPSVHIGPILSENKTEQIGLADDTVTDKQNKVQGRRIIIDHADDTENLTWAGQSWETDDIRPVGQLIVDEVDLVAGFDLRSTEAILLSFTL